MWGHTPEELLRRRATAPPPGTDLHNRDAARDETRHDNNSEHGISGEATQPPSLETASVAGPGRDAEGETSWGERDMGGPVSRQAAMDEFEELQRELSRLSNTRSVSQRSEAGRSIGLFKTASRKSTARSRKSQDDGAGRSRKRRAGGSRRPGDPEKLDRAEKGTYGEQGSTRNKKNEEEEDREELEDDDDDDTDAESEAEFQLEQFMRDGHLQKRNADGESTKKVGVVFKNLTVKGVSSGATFVRTLPQAVLGTFGPDLYHILCGWFPALRFGRQPPLRELIHDFTGVVRHGEMMLVLGRPGSGCSTFLKVIANERGSYADVAGDVSYSGISAGELAKYYRGEAVYNEENDQHLPTLTVWQTLKFSLLNKTKKHARGDVDLIIDALMKMFGISHTRNTLVGNEYVRGVSGGERKRVSIAEALATKSGIVCWDNSTRGLDASTALDYARSLRIMTDVSDRTTITTLYQAGEGIYELMDKVLVIDSGRMLYQGPANQARQYFEDLGFYAPQRQTTADFLTSVCDVNARQFREGFEDSCPKTPEELEQAFRKSAAYRAVLADVDEFERHLQETGHAEAREFQESVQHEKSRTVPKRSSYTVSFWRQTLACTRREFWLIWGDRTSLYTKLFTVIANGLIVGSLFYNTPSSTSGAFLRGGTSFFSIVFLGWLQLSELMKAVSGRDVIARHKSFAFYRPSAVNLARVLTDFPLLAVQVVIFGVIMFFMTGMDLHPGKFFIFILFQFITTLCLTALYRMFAALSPTIDDAVRFSGISLNLLVIYTGYVMAKPVLLGQKIWFGWIYHVNPLSYSFEAVLTNEFTNRVLDCAPGQLVPQGPGIGPANQGCAIAGAQLGSLAIPGDDYVAAQYEYSRGHLWRNFGVVIAFAVLYILVTVLATEFISFSHSGGGALVFKRSRRAKSARLGDAQRMPDEEKAARPGEAVMPPEQAAAMARTRTQDEVLGELSRNESIFTWEDLSYTVPTGQGPKRLLNDVSGYAKPGVLCALVGASGAGKTTLLNTLSQRQTVGVVTGDMLVDGRPLGTGFQRSTGFVEQMDLHDETATVREALEFSAILRQGRDVPRTEKLEYVDKIIDLLELQEIQDAVIASLGVEQKKRLTIGVELAAKPSLLLFLDEPTSGLDSQSAFSIVRFLKKLCAAGQAIVCTIHQPSSDLIQQFDRILALNPGGNVFYFGPVGADGSAVIKYFADRGVQCPPGKNVAEFILETAAKRSKRADGTKIDWNHEWRVSAEKKQLLEEITQLKEERSRAIAALSAPQEGGASPSQPTQHEFAAPVWTQTVALTKRMFIHQWREPSYIYGKLFTAVVVGIFNGFTFWQLGNTVADMQNRMFTSFLIIVIPPTVLNAVLPKFYQDRALWEAREHPSRIYGWVAFCTASVVAEIPGSLLSGVLYFLLWYFPTGLPYDAPAAGYVFLMTILFFLFQSSWGQWICAWAPSFTVISNVLPLFLVLFSLFNGVVVPYASLNVFWKYWLYWANPSTYWIAGVMAATLSNQVVECAPSEAGYFNPPAGQTCQDFASDFVRLAGQGYLTNPNATSDCGYCPYANGIEYMASLNVSPDQKWRDFGIFLVFCFSNWALVYFFIYTVRIRGWTFGFNAVSKLSGKAASAASRLLVRGKGDGPTRA